MAGKVPEIHIPDRERLGGAFVTYALPLVLIAIVYTLPLLFQGMVADSHDLITYNLRYLSWAGHPLSLWNDLWSGGMPAVASPHDDRYYPLGFPFYLLFQDLRVMNLILLGHLYLAYLTMRRLAGVATRDNLLLLLAGLTYAFSGMFLSRIDIGHVVLVFALAWLPLVYDSLLRILDQRTSPAWGALVLALSFTLFFFTGSLYHVVYACIFMAIIVACFALTRRVTRGAWYSLCAGGLLALLLTSVKAIPDIVISPYLERIDIIDPLTGGGSVEATLASFVSGIPATPDFGHWESAVLIGTVPLLFTIVALLFGKREIAAAGFASILFSLVWADSGRSLLSFIHLIPVVSGFRAPGRVYGAVLPIVLLLAVYGVAIVAGRIHRGERLVLDRDAKNRLLWGIALLAAVKVMELPWQKMPGIPEAGAVLITAGFLVLIVSGRADYKTIPLYAVAAVLGEIILLAVVPPGAHPPDLTGGLLIAVVITAGCYALMQWRSHPVSTKLLCATLVAGLIVSVAASTAFVAVHDPTVENSPMKAVIGEIRTVGSVNPLTVIMETGRKYEHGDLAYWAAVSGIQHSDAYYPYFLAGAPDNAYTIDGKEYYLSDYIVDTRAVETGVPGLQNVTFSAGGVGVKRLSPPLPTVFVMRQGSLVPSSYAVFSPDKVILSGQFLRGDTAVLKYAFAPGWVINDVAASRLNNLTAAALPADSTTVTFRFEPWYFTAGAVVSLAGVAGFIALFLVRRRFDQWCGAGES